MTTSYVSGNKVKLTDISTDTPLSKACIIQLSLCQFNIEWKIIYSEDGNVFDVIPMLDTFNSIEGDPYKPIDAVFSISKPISTKDIATLLVQSLLESQSAQLQGMHDSR